MIYKKNINKSEIIYGISIIISICILILYGLTYFPKLSPVNNVIVAISAFLSICLGGIISKCLINIRNTYKDKDLFEFVIVGQKKWIKYLLLILFFNIIMSFFMMLKLENGGFSPEKRGEKYLIEYRGTVTEVSKEENLIITASSNRVLYSFCILFNLISLMVLHFKVKYDIHPDCP
jgi:hypothetical protein